MWGVLRFHSWPSMLMMMLLSQRRAGVSCVVRWFWLTYFIIPLCIMKKSDTRSIIYAVQSRCHLAVPQLLWSYLCVFSPPMAWPPSSLRHGPWFPSYSNSKRTGVSMALSSSPLAGKDLISRRTLYEFEQSEIKLILFYRHYKIFIPHMFSTFTAEKCFVEKVSHLKSICLLKGEKLHISLNSPKMDCSSDKPIFRCFVFCCNQN